jgi:hypothetical protein
MRVDDEIKYQIGLTLIDSIGDIIVMNFYKMNLKD